MNPRSAPYLAFSCLLITLLTSSALLQSIGFLINIPLVRYALPIAFLPCLWLTYGYFFAPSPRNIIVGVALSVILTALGISSAQVLDLSVDGMAYQQPAVNAILHGWNPLDGNSTHIYHNSFPFGVWAMEASLAALYGSAESGKALQVWWLFIVLPVLLAGLRAHFAAPLQPCHYLIALLAILNPVVIGQLTTFYVDGLIYLEGLTFIGALLMFGTAQSHRKLPHLFMALAIFSLISTKLSGAYWSVVLCMGAIAYSYHQQRQHTIKLAAFLLLCGTVCICIICYHPYITNLLTYDSVMPLDYKTLEDSLRPANFTPLGGIERFFYSIFSVADGSTNSPAVQKWPWTMTTLEWQKAAPDFRSGGFGPLFALGLLLSALLACICHAYTYGAKRSLSRPQKAILWLILPIAIFSIAFPESWWARFVPLFYAAPFLLLLTIASGGKRTQWGIYAACLIFAANSAITIKSNYSRQNVAQRAFYRVIDKLHERGKTEVYLVPKAGKWHYIFNLSHLIIMRRLQENGIKSSLQVDAPCPNHATTWINSRICYE